MNSKERVTKTITFNKPDIIPVHSWVLPAAAEKYKTELEEMRKECPEDFGGDGYKDPFEMIKAFDVGEYTDPWGCVWENHIKGILGQVQRFPFNDWSSLGTFKPPIELADKGFEDVAATLRKNKDKFIFSPIEGLFHRMCWLRDPALCFMDLLEETPEFFTLLDMVHDVNLRRLRNFLKYDYDAMFIGDDWGSQRSLLINPETWRSYFKPRYKEYFDLAKKAGKLVFMHSDGYIIDIIEDLIEIGVNALNCQVFIMGAENLSEKFKGRICFYGEIDRQHVLPNGSSDDIIKEIETGKKCFSSEKGGYIFQAEIGPDVPADNIRTLFRTWQKMR